MNLEEAKSSVLLFAMVGFVLLVVLFMTILFAIKSWNQARRLGYTKDNLFRVAKSTIAASIVPSLAIVIGLFTLAATLGNAWPWLRLSVMGALTYEIMAAEMAASSMETTLAQLTSVKEFVNVILVMSVGVISGTIVLVIFGEKVHKGAIKLGENKHSFGMVALELFMIGLLATFLPVVLTQGLVALLTFVTSLLITVVLGLLMKKYNIKWLKDFILAIALLVGMASSILWTGIFG